MVCQMVIHPSDALVVSTPAQIPTEGFITGK
jgi:hypothetical protein